MSDCRENEGSNISTKNSRSAGGLRIKYWDVAKGIAIILMVLGHVWSSPIEMRAFIFSFHMPLFFVANAFFIKKYDVKRSLIRSSKSILVPYTVIAMIAAVIAMILSNGDDPVKLFLDKVVAMLFSSSRSPQYFPQIENIWAIWFLTCLFIARNLYIFIRCIGEKAHITVSVVISVIVFFTGFYIGTTGFFMPWSFDIAFVAIAFMWFGDILHISGFLEKKIFWFITPAALVGWIILVNNGFWIEMAVKEYRGEGWCFATAFLGCIVFIALSKILERFKLICIFLSWVGKNSMVILGFHNIDTMFFNWATSHTYGLPEEYAWIVRFIVQICLTLLFTFIFTVIKEFIKQRMLTRRNGYM